MTYGTLVLHDFFWKMVFGNVVSDVHMGYSAFTITLSYTMMAISGILLLLYPLSTKTQKSTISKYQF